MTQLLNERHDFPHQLLNAKIDELFKILQRPTLIHLNGAKDSTLFVSTLLHGNEHTGFLAIQKLLTKYKNQNLPRNLSLFIGNVEAAEQNKRMLPHQPDYNRIWSDAKGPEAALTAQVIAIMKRHNLFASVDIHNNSGKNPYYSCITTTKPQHMHLATLFGRTVVYFNKPHTTFTATFSQFVPAVTLECGLSNDLHAVDKACDYIDSLLHLDHIPERQVSHHDIDLYESFARIRIPEDTTFCFSDEQNQNIPDFILRADLDFLNFSEVPAETSLGFINQNSQKRLLLEDADGGPFDEQLLDYDHGIIKVKEMTIPSMFTKNKEVIRADCLGYFMRRMTF